VRLGSADRGTEAVEDSLHLCISHVTQGSSKWYSAAAGDPSAVRVDPPREGVS